MCGDVASAVIGMHGPKLKGLGCVPSSSYPLICKAEWSSKPLWPTFNHLKSVFGFHKTSEMCRRACGCVAAVKAHVALAHPACVMCGAAGSDERPLTVQGPVNNVH